MGATFFGMNCFNNFLLIDATNRSKISSDQKRLFFAVRLFPLSFFASTPFKLVFNPVYLVKLEGEEKVDDSDDELSILGDSIVRNIQIKKPNLCLPWLKCPALPVEFKKIEIL